MNYAGCNLLSASVLVMASACSYLDHDSCFGRSCKTNATSMNQNTRTTLTEYRSFVNGR